jgi:hypothetical protein
LELSRERGAQRDSLDRFDLQCVAVEGACDPGLPGCLGDHLAANQLSRRRGDVL